MEPSVAQVVATMAISALIANGVILLAGWVSGRSGWDYARRDLTSTLGPVAVEDDLVRAVEPGRHRLVNDRVGVRRLLGDAADRTLEDLAFVGLHGGILECRQTRLSERPRTLVFGSVRPSPVFVTDTPVLASTPSGAKIARRCRGPRRRHAGATLAAARWPIERTGVTMHPGEFLIPTTAEVVGGCLVLLIVSATFCWALWRAGNRPNLRRSNDEARGRLHDGHGSPPWLSGADVRLHPRRDRGRVSGDGDHQADNLTG
jgi:hypothetical protein